MRADKIIKNAKIFTANEDNPMATALVVKDGKFVYVGDENGLSEYEGEVTDLGGKFVMPSLALLLITHHIGMQIILIFILIFLEKKELISFSVAKQSGIVEH